MKTEAFITFAVIVIIIAVAAYLCNEDAKRWGKFKTEHHCRVIAMQRGQCATGTGIGMGSNGSVVPITTTSCTEDTTTYMCDNGIQYTR